MPEQTVVLSITETESGFTCRLTFNGESLTSDRALSERHIAAIRDMAARYGALFENPALPRLDEGAAEALGETLHEIWFAPAWTALAQRLGLSGDRVLIVASSSPAVLNLPWELWRPPGGECVGSDPSWRLRRFPWTDQAPGPPAGPLRPGPLRVLYMVCAPTDQQTLDYEREEEMLLRALTQGRTPTVVESGDLGSFDELSERIDEFKPHIVHLSGHAQAGEHGAVFLFEDESGLGDPRTAEELRTLFAGSGVECVFLSGCQTGKAPSRAALGGLAQALVAQGVPLAIGWAASIEDGVASQLAERFYTAVADGLPADHALARARQKIRQDSEGRNDPSWSLPVLYAATTRARIFDHEAPPSRIDRVNRLQHPLPGMPRGYAQHFVGRRRPLQQLLPALRTGAVQSAFLTGLGGIGKSTLATRLARKLESDGFTPIAVSSRTDLPLGAQLLEACGDAFREASRAADHATLRDAKLDVAERLRALVSGLNRGRFVLVIDNFESNLDPDTRRIIDPELAQFYRYLLDHLSGDSRLIVTSRYVPGDVADLPPLTRTLALPEFGEAEFLKFLLRDTLVERRYRAGELPHTLLVRLHRVLGATPRLLEQIRKVLQTISANDLTRELDLVALPKQEKTPVGRLQTLRDEYCETIFTARLYGGLSPESQSLLSRIAVFAIPMTLAGWAAAADVALDRIEAERVTWQNAALIHGDAGSGTGLWSVYGMLRSWLTAPERLSERDRQAAHHRAGDFLAELDRQDREGELGLEWVTCLLEARSHYLEAGVYGPARKVTDRISGHCVRNGLYTTLQDLNAELLAGEPHPGPANWIGRAHLECADYAASREWYRAALTFGTGTSEAAIAWHGLASIDLSEGAYGAAREKFGKALTIRQQNKDAEGEAATWHQLATIDLKEGAFSLAREKFNKSLDIVEQIDNEAGEAVAWLQVAATWHGLASIDLEEGDLGPAREKFNKSLEIVQRIENKAGEAALWHQLASIDFKEGAFGPAREKFGRSLAIEREIGERPGEATTWQQLGFLAAKLGRAEEGLRLVALCFLIDRSIGHGDAKQDFHAVLEIAGGLGYTKIRLDAMLEETEESYRRDRGASLLAAAFPEDAV